MTQETAPSPSNPLLDKKGADLDRQRFQMLEDIARELSGEIIFPTSFDLVLRLRKALQDPDISRAQLVALITLDPLVSARILSLANSAYYNPGGVPISDLPRAIDRLGLQAVRTTALAIAMKQLLAARDVASAQEQATRLWQHSLRTASAAYVVARRLTRLNPEEALLAGMVHDLGAFYMIYRAAQYEELLLRPDTTKYLVIRWHESVGHSLAVALGLPEAITAAILDHDQPRPLPNPPKSLTDVVHLANLIAGGLFEWLDLPLDTAAKDYEEMKALSASLQDEIDAHEAAIRVAFG